MPISHRNILLNLRADQIAPFESSFSVILKLISLNLIDRGTLYSYITRYKGEDYSEFSSQYWLGGWVDFEQFSFSTGISENELKSCFIDMLVPFYDDRPVSIKHCGTCISLGYHCVFSYLQGVTYCPIHNEELVYCKECSSALIQMNLAPVKARSNDRGLYGLRLGCGHFSFDCNMGVHLCNYDARFRELAWERGVCLLKWFNAVAKLDSPFGGYLLEGYKEGFGRAGVAHICIDYCTKMLGDCPLERSDEYSGVPMRSLDCNLPVDAKKPDSKECFAVFKSIRRHLYRSHVKIHARCFSALKSLRCHELCCLASKDACSVSSAFIAWSIAIQQHPFERKRNPLLNLVGSIDHHPGSIKEMAVYWLAHFYGIWGDIELALRHCASHGETFRVELGGDELRLNERCVSCVMGACSNSFLIPDADYLSSAAFIRCLGKLQLRTAINAESLSNIKTRGSSVSSALIMQFWSEKAVEKRRRPSETVTVYIG